MTGPIAQQTPSSTYTHQVGGSSGLADVIDLILEKGLVIDVFARVALVGIEILTVDARIVVASVDTYLRFAEACNRLDLVNEKSSQGLPQFVGGMQESGAKDKTKGALEGAEERLRETFTPSSEGDGEKEPARRRASRKKEEED